MLLATSELLDMPVMSLQTGGEIATTTSVIVDPANLHILAYELDGSQLDESPAFLKIEDIRELSDIGFIVDSSDEIISFDDIVIGKGLYKKPTQLTGMKVVDDHGSKLGKVEQAIMSTDTFRVEQLHVRQPFFKSLSDTELIIGRRQIINITNDTITVRTPEVKEKENRRIEKQPLLNPFRGASPPQPESLKSDRQ